MKLFLSWRRSHIIVKDYFPGQGNFSEIVFSSYVELCLSLFLGYSIVFDYLLQTIISGMGELHLDIYTEVIKT